MYSVYDLDDDNTPVSLSTVNHVYIYTWAEGVNESSDKFSEASIVGVEPYPRISTLQIQSNTLRERFGVQPQRERGQRVVCVFESSVFESMSAADLESNIIDFVSTLTLTSGLSEFGYNHTFTTTNLQQYDVHEFSHAMTKAFADLADNSVTSDITTGVEYTVCVSLGCGQRSQKRVYHTNIMTPP